MASALALQKAGRLDEAEQLYRSVLAIAADDAACLHMLGVICVRKSRMAEAVTLFLRAGALTVWKIPAVRQNLGLALNRMFVDALSTRRIAYAIWRSKRESRCVPGTPLVSVLIPSCNHAEFIEECLESVYRQTWRQIELIVIDDGSCDDSVRYIRDSLQSCPFPYVFIPRENRGTHATISEAIDLAHGEYINVLNSDDRFPQHRIERMVQRIACIDADWGFAGVDLIDGAGQSMVGASGSMAGRLRAVMDTLAFAPTVGFALLRENVAISSGNLFMRKAFFSLVGGFLDVRPNHDREFVLRATLQSEPVHVAEPLYEYRIHATDTISESLAQAGNEADHLIGEGIRSLLADQSAPNLFAPTRKNWGDYALHSILRYGFGNAFQAEQIADMAQMVIAASGPHVEPLIPVVYSALPELQQAAPLLDAIQALKGGSAPSFDQYQRYGMIACAIDKLRSPGQVFSILEVGANTHKLLGKLLPLDRIVYLDREIPAEMQGASDIIVGDATDLAMAAGTFDIVVSLDVFEHIAPARRADFLRHTTRVARLLTAIAAPFDDVAVREAELAASAYWNSLFPYTYRWLEEHAENGLPDLGETIVMLKELGVEHCGFGHGRLDLWREMMKAHFATAACPELQTALGAMDHYYREHLFAHDTDTGPTYRQFVFCIRSPDVMHLMRGFCADYRKDSKPLQLEPVFDVLDAMQQIASQQKKAGAN